MHTGIRPSRFEKAIPHSIPSFSDWLSPMPCLNSIPEYGMNHRMCFSSPGALAAAIVVGLLPLASQAQTSSSGPADFNRDIRPLFAKHCTACHGGVKAAGGVRDLDTLLKVRALGVTRCGASRTSDILDEWRQRLNLSPIVSGAPAVSGY